MQECRQVIETILECRLLNEDIGVHTDGGCEAFGHCVSGGVADSLCNVENVVFSSAGGTRIL